MGGAVRTAVKAPETKKGNKVSQVQKGNFYHSVSSPVEQILFLQKTIGNEVVQKLMKTGALQAKLRIGAPGDVYEQEADWVAEQVMRMPEPLILKETKVSSQRNSVQRECPKCIKDKPRKDEEEETLQKKEVSGSPPEVAPELESRISAIRGGGQPLPEFVRAFYEPRFGHDFSGVRVHTDTKAAGSARAVNALAFTVGRDVVFGEGQYAPNTKEGQRLLAHEFTHVVQQDKQPTSFIIQQSPRQGTKPKSYGFGEEPYEAKEFELSFSDEEKRWIEEVFALPEIALILSSYKDLPVVELHRVKEIISGANGESKEKKIAIASKVYAKKGLYPAAKDKKGKMVTPAKKEMFKETLIHELVHFFEKYTRDIEEKEKIIVPSTLVKALVHPEETAFNLPPYAFGWFIHPKSKFIFHFDLPCVLSVTDPKCTILGEPDLRKIRNEKKYESSPMPESGMRISAEEDIAASISLYLTSANSKKLLETKYPLRYKLIDWYFKYLKRL